MAKNILLRYLVFLFVGFGFVQASHAKTDFIKLAHTILKQTGLFSVAGDIRTLHSSPSGQLLKISTHNEFILYDLKTQKKITPFEKAAGFNPGQTVWLSQAEDKAFAFTPAGLIAIELNSVWAGAGAGSATNIEVLYPKPRGCYFDDLEPALLNPDGAMIFVQTCEADEQEFQHLSSVD